ncbi:TIGR04282 family arsenosugar biosynthesis glycosyltransferase [Marinobacterium litorale]|uniref:TIGR04282 family arsenosugar biosynthesis glycosyltransferase n=1 Tax=Marinobacterium litorale TaxID=404770 RepID=UPI0004205E19|nr:TIGR04282 family arsenosugar biosynthesis glycosyltransferase [Marinobacterium litorale]
MTPKIVILAKAPLPGYAKTRLIPALGAEGAARVAERMLLHTLNEARAADIGPVELSVTPDSDDSYWQDLPSDVLTGQGDGDLGERMARIAHRVTAEPRPVILIGTDCPALDRYRLREIAQQLQGRDAVLAPAHDGGYVALGLNAYASEVFQAIPWSTERVAELTRKRLRELGWQFHELEVMHDIDEPTDLIHLPADLMP